MQGNKEQQEISVIGRLLSLEALVCLMGVASLLYGAFYGSLGHLLTGTIVLVVAAFLIRRWRR